MIVLRGYSRWRPPSNDCSTAISASRASPGSRFRRASSASNSPPGKGPQVVTSATFNEARITSVEAYPVDADDLELPWDVYGFDCYESGEGRWRFVLHCASIEWCFESAWPTVERTVV